MKHYKLIFKTIYGNASFEVEADNESAAQVIMESIHNGTDEIEDSNYSEIEKE